MSQKFKSFIIFIENLLIKKDKLRSNSKSLKSNIFLILINLFENQRTHNNLYLEKWNNGHFT